MDALKGAAAALKNSPRLVRKKMMRVKKKTSNSFFHSSSVHFNQLRLILFCLNFPLSKYD